ncbi:unnamed protein product [Paramecium octaurelia]|uniref:Uncharacterized protein n=1 Tax=Paramecium octaurelia TaxID=43137 RepID=A0A8S1TCM4_PAROT|nr:unnamed protein product [Paramecium octaurelia]
MNENENILLSDNSFNQQKFCITPSKPERKIKENYILQTPITPNVQRTLFTNHKNLSASKFIIDEQLVDQQISQIEVDQAVDLIQEICLRFNLTFSKFSIVSQDVIRLIYLFKEIKMICTYPIEKLYDFLNVVQMRYPNSISLVVSSQKLPSLLQINDIFELRQIKQGLVNITYLQLYRRDSDTIMQILRSLNVKQAFYFDDVEQCRYLLSDNIKQHIVCNRGVLPATNIQELRNYLSIQTSYIGPTLDIGHIQSEYKPNYQLNKVIFMDSESFSRMLTRLEEQNLQSVALKFSNNKNITAFEDFCINNQITCKYQAISSSAELKTQYEVLVHVDQVNSLQAYLNDCAFLNKDCISIVYLSKEQYLLKRKSLFFQQTSLELLEAIYNQLCTNQNKVNLNQIKQSFMIDNPMKLMNMLEKHQLIQIDTVIPLKCSVSIDTMADTNSEYINQLIKYIKLHSRRIISLRKDVSTIKHFEIDLEDVSKFMNKPIIELCIQIESKSKVFLEPEFYDFLINYQITDHQLHFSNNNKMKNQLFQCAQDITKIKQQQIQELDIWFCLGQMLKISSLSKCVNYYSNQQKFAEIVDKYFTAENKLTVGELFQHNHIKYMPIKTIEGLREKTKIITDIRKIYQTIQKENDRDIQHKIPINRRVHYELMKQYLSYDLDQLSDLVNYYIDQQNKQTQRYRVKGWLLDLPIKKVKY